MDEKGIEFSHSIELLFLDTNAHLKEPAATVVCSLFGGVKKRPLVVAAAALVPQRKNESSLLEGIIISGR